MDPRFAAASDLQRLGYHIVPGFWDAADCRTLRHHVDQLATELGCSGGGGGDFGFIIHPFLPRVPACAHYFARADLVSMLGEILGDDPRLAHSGALISDQSRRFTSWHYHRNDSEQEQVWDLGRTERPERIRRVLAQIYLDGSSAEVGELLLVPRSATDPLAPPRLDRTSEWPEQVVVVCPPGSLVIFDQCVFHAARGGRSSTRRRLVGGHYQGWSERSPHREDQLLTTRGMRGAMSSDSLLAHLLMAPDPS